MDEEKARLSASPLLPRTGARDLRSRAPGLAAFGRSCASVDGREGAAQVSPFGETVARAFGARVSWRADWLAGDASQVSPLGETVARRFAVSDDWFNWNARPLRGLAARRKQRFRRGLAGRFAASS